MIEDEASETKLTRENYRVTTRAVFNHLKSKLRVVAFRNGSYLPYTAYMAAPAPRPPSIPFPPRKEAADRSPMAARCPRGSDSKQAVQGRRPWYAKTRGGDRKPPLLKTAER